MMKAKHSSKKGIGGKPHRDHSKPSYGSGKAKESRHKSPDSPEECALSFPDLHNVDKSQLITYHQVLNRSKDEGVGMEDLDRLQLELEMLLTGVAVRIRDLNNEIATLNIAEERRDKKIKLALTTSKKKMDDKKTRDPTGKSRPRIGTLDDPSVLGSPEQLKNTASLEPPKILIPKNDIPHKFWLSVEPYCADITADDIKFLKDLKASCEKDAEIQKIPPLGRHYTLRWAEEDMLEEKDSSAVIKLKRKSPDDVKDMLKRASKIVIRERIPGPLVQRLVSALVEENYISPLDEAILNNKISKMSSDSEASETPNKKTKLEESSENKESAENTVPNYIKKLPTYHTTACFELRIRKELEAAGFLDTKDYKEEDDEILAEIKKCQEELRAASLNVVEQLNRLIQLAEVELQKSEVRKKIKQVEQEIIDAARKILLAKQKKKPLSEKDTENTWRLLNERKNLLKDLESVSC